MWTGGCLGGFCGRKGFFGGYRELYFLWKRKIYGREAWGERRKGEVRMAGTDFKARSSFALKEIQKNLRCVPKKIPH